MKLELATAADAPHLVALRLSVNRRLESEHGPGYWLASLTEQGALRAIRTTGVYVGRDENQRLIATLALSTRKPWSIDKKYLNPASRRPLYLTSMAVHSDEQRRGIGRLCIEQILPIAREWPADALRLDAYDAPAGAGEFYRKCGFREFGRAVYRSVPLIYFEMLL